MSENQRAEFTIVGEPFEVLGDRGNVVVCSRQKLTQPEGNSSEFIVVKKFKRAVDGTQTGKVSQVFLPVDMAQAVAEAILSFKKR